MARDRPTICITLSQELLSWLDSKVEDRTFATRSFGIERALIEIRKREEGEE
jgi:metal-responsive CopG/Arc/MetJ family transcriptional regulator